MGLLDISKEINAIEIRKQKNKILSEARKNAKPTKCILCGKKQTSFCNSHSVPQLVLKSIASNGIVLHASDAMGFDDTIVDIENGINKSGTFNLYYSRLCRASC